MPKIDIANLPVYTGSSYPAPHDRPCKTRTNTSLTRDSGVTQFGVQLTVLVPGAWSSQRHWHSHEDEFVYVLEGEVVMITDAGRETLRSGECATFAAGVKDGHHLVNESDSDTRLLTVGTRDDRDHGEYSDIDMQFRPGPVSGETEFVTKDGKPI